MSYLGTDDQDQSTDPESKSYSRANLGMAVVEKMQDKLGSVRPVREISFSLEPFVDADDALAEFIP